MPIGFTAGSPYHHQYETEGNENINDTFHYTTHSFLGSEYNDGKAAAFKKVKEGLDVTALQEKAKGWGNVHTHMNDVWSKLNEAYNKLFVDGAWSGDDADKASKTFRDTMDSASNMAEYAGNMHTGMNTIAAAAASAAGVSSGGPSALGQFANYETFGLAGFNGNGDQAEQAYFTLVGKINDGRQDMPSQLEWQAKPDAGSAGGTSSPYGGTGSHGGAGSNGGSGVSAVSAPNGGGGTPSHSSVAAQSVPFTGKAFSTSGRPGKTKGKPPTETEQTWTSPGNGTEGIATDGSGGGTGFDSGGAGGAGIGSNGVGVDSGSTLAGYDGSGVGGGGSAAGLGGGSAAGLGGGSAAGLGGGSGGSATGLGGGSGLAGSSAAGLGDGSSAGLRGAAGSASGSSAADAAGRERSGVGGQVAPMRGGGGGGGDESERDRSTWLQEDDDVWGETDAPPSVIS